MKAWECTGAHACAGQCVGGLKHDADDDLTPAQAARIFAEPRGYVGIVHVEQTIPRGPRRGTHLHTFRVRREVSYKVEPVR